MVRLKCVSGRQDGSETRNRRFRVAARSMKSRVEMADEINKKKAAAAAEAIGLVVEIVGTVVGTLGAGVETLDTAVGNAELGVEHR